MPGLIRNDQPREPSPDAMLSGPLLFAKRLPLPPSANNLYRTGKDGKRYKTQKATAFRNAVQAIALTGRALNDKRSSARLAVAMRFYPPDERARDIANVEKATLDALKGVIYIDDSQVDRLLITRGPFETPGCVDIWIRELAGDD